MLDRLKSYSSFVRDLLLVPLVMVMPRNKKKIIFGAWAGHQYSCNPKHLFEYMVRRGGFDCYWIGEPHLKDAVLSNSGAKFLTKGSVRAFWHCLTAKFYVCNVQWKSDVMRIPTCGRVTHFYLTHGMPDKKMGEFQYNGNGAAEKTAKGNTLRLFLRNVMDRVDRWMFDQRSWGSFSSEQSRDLYIENLPNRLSVERSICCGTPRGDYMIHSAYDVGLRNLIKAKYAKLLNLPRDKKWYIFVPTWRHEKEYLFSFSTSKRLADYQKLLADQNAVLIEKQHPITLETLGIGGEKVGAVTIVSSAQARQIELQELLVACDRLITDYSSVYYDFVMMNRPVLHFTYDYDHFMTKDMGFCYDIREYGGGPFAYAEDELMKYLTMDDANLLSLRNAKTQEQLSSEKGHACEGYYDLIERLSKK